LFPAAVAKMTGPDSIDWDVEERDWAHGYAQ